MCRPCRARISAQKPWQKCSGLAGLPFKGRHKLEDAYGRESYTVVWKNEQDDVYRIRSVNGGQEKTVNRKYVRLDPLAEAEFVDESFFSDDLEWDVVVTKPTVKK